MARFSTALADRCVKCGLCLPHCPTYAVHGNEAESPRGRIAMMDALARGRIPPAPTTLAHIDHCLGCRACESACPAQVPYGQLLDAHRADHLRGLPRARAVVGEWLFTSAGGRTLLRLLEWLSRPLRRVWPNRLPGARQMQLLPRLSAPRTRSAAAHGDALLFTGCISELASGPALQALDEVCANLGMHMSAPAGQSCCGALARHAGLETRADRHAAANRAAFAGEGPVVGLDSACVAELGEQDAARGRASEACAFVLEHWPQTVSPRPLSGRVLLHAPCSHRNVLGNIDAPRRLLERLPGLEVVPLAIGKGCCGAAGAHMIEFPAQADALASDIVAAARDADADWLATTNIGCRLHLQAALRRDGLDIPVIHPIELVQRALAHD